MQLAGVIIFSRVARGLLLELRIACLLEENAAELARAVTRRLKNK